MIYILLYTLNIIGFTLNTLIITMGVGSSLNILGVIKAGVLIETANEQTDERIRDGLLKHAKLLQ